LRDIKGEDVLLPRILLRKGTSLFLDGLDVREVEHRSGCAVHLLDPTAAALVEHICMLGGVRL
jgi:NifB/MoaA-like Fe-S oxidoreductase